MLGYRLVHGSSLMRSRSFCPHCQHTLSFWDLVPIISWLYLKAQCRYCKHAISWLYPFIEVLTIITLLALTHSSAFKYLLAYFFFFSCLIIAIRTDLETLLIPRHVTLYALPFGLLFSWSSLLPISLTQSALGALAGYLILWVIAKTFFYFTHKEGMGQGDLELLACIGSFTGPIGVWVTLLIGSITGSIIGLISVFTHKTTSTTKLPFGPFLAFGAIIYVLFQKQLLFLFS